jgi:hypothetical protein
VLGHDTTLQLARGTDKGAGQVHPRDYLFSEAPRAREEPNMTTSNPKKGDPVDGRDPAASNLEKDPDDWVTGDEPMTGAQASYLKTLCEEANEEFDPKLSKAEASKRIDALRDKTGKGSPAAAARSDAQADSPADN